MQKSAPIFRVPIHDDRSKALGLGRCYLSFGAYATPYPSVLQLDDMFMNRPHL